MAVSHDDEFCPDLLEDLNDLPEERTIADLQRPRKGSRREASDWARLLTDAGSSPAGEVIHDPDGEPLVRSEHDAELAILGLDPDSQHPDCDWCEEEERHGLKSEVHGRWWMHIDCYVDAESNHLGSLNAPPRLWEWDEQSQAPACGLRSKPRPPAMTDEQIVEVVSLRQWKFSQQEIAQRLGGQSGLCVQGADGGDCLLCLRKSRSWSKRISLSRSLSDSQSTDGPL